MDFVPLLRALSSKTEGEFARDSEAIYKSFLGDILKPWFSEEGDTATGIALLATLAQHAKEQGDAMKCECLVEFCEVVAASFDKYPSNVIAFLGPLYECGLLFPAAHDFRTILVAAVIANVDGAAWA